MKRCQDSFKIAKESYYLFVFQDTREQPMDFDTDKVDEAVLALLHLTKCDDKFGAAAWKSHDWDALNRLHEKGYIGNPVNKNKSVALTEEGRVKAEELFRKLFGKAK